MGPASAPTRTASTMTQPKARKFRATTSYTCRTRCASSRRNSRTLTSTVLSLVPRRSWRKDHISSRSNRKDHMNSRPSVKDHTRPRSSGKGHLQPRTVNESSQEIHNSFVHILIQSSNFISRMGATAIFLSDIYIPLARSVLTVICISLAVLEAA